MKMLSLQGVSKNFWGLRAVSDVSFDVDQGQMVGLMGANGAGKTTLFNLITGHLAPSHGQILLNGENIAGLRPDAICRRGVGRTFQIVKPFPGLTVRDNLLTAALFGSDRYRNREAARQHCDDILRETGMLALADVPASDLTLARQKKLELARAVATDCKLLLLDEVMAGLTPTEVAEVTATIRQLRDARGLTVLIIEHVMRALMDLSERIVVLHHGQKIAEGAPEDIASNSRVHDVYFGEAV